MVNIDEIHNIPMNGLNLSGEEIKIYVRTKTNLIREDQFHQVWKRIFNQNTVVYL